MCMFIYLFVVYFSFAPVISAITHRYCELFYIQVLMMVIKTETLMSTSHHDIFTYLDYIFPTTFILSDFIHIYFHIYIYIYIDTQAHTRICFYMYIYIYIYIHICKHMYIYTHELPPTHEHTYIHTYIYIYVLTRIDTHKQIYMYTQRYIFFFFLIFSVYIYDIKC